MEGTAAEEQGCCVTIIALSAIGGVSILTFIFVCPMWVSQVRGLEKLHGDGCRLDIEVVLGQAHQQEEGGWCENFQCKSGPATDAQE